MKEICKYRLPCGRCDKFNTDCDLTPNDIRFIVEDESKDKEWKEHDKKCEHNWVFCKSIMHTGGKDIVYRCSKCGASMVKSGGVIYQSSDEWQT